MKSLLKFFSSKKCSFEKNETVVSPTSIQELNTNTPSPYNGSLITSNSDNLSTLNYSPDEIELLNSQPNEQSQLDNMHGRNGHELEPTSINSIASNVKVEDTINNASLMETDHVIQEENENVYNFDNANSVEIDVHLNKTVDIISKLDDGFKNETFAGIEAPIRTRTNTVDTVTEDQFEIGKVDPYDIECATIKNDLDGFHIELSQNFTASENSELNPVYADLATVDTYFDYYQNFITQSKKETARYKDLNFMVSNTQDNIEFEPCDNFATELLKEFVNEECKDAGNDKKSNFEDHDINSVIDLCLDTDDFESLLPRYTIANDIARMKTISISSEDIQLNTADSDSDGYISSDFEFITEKEAKLDGLIINFRSQNNKAKPKRSPTTKDIAKVSNDNKLNLPGGSSNGRLTKKDYKSVNEDSFDHSYKHNHVVPEGEAYLHLFQGYYNPAVIDYWHNKAIDYSQTPRSAMLVEYEGIGFDMQVLNAKNEELNNYTEEVKQEAKSTQKKILDMYPYDN